jgi:MoxR-like ATPase
MKIESKALAELLAQKIIEGTVTPETLAGMSEHDMIDLVTAKAPEETEKTTPVKPKMDTDPFSYVQIGDCFVVQEAIYKLLKRNVGKSVNTMLLGPTGVGKTELIANIARELDVPLTIFDMGTMTDPIMSLVGSHVVEVENGVTKSVFKRSRFSEVIQ